MQLHLFPFINVAPCRVSSKTAYTTKWVKKRTSNVQQIADSFT